MRKLSAENRPKRRGWGLSLIFLIIASASAYFIFNIVYRGGDVSLSLDVPENAVVGLPTDITVILQNNSGDVLRDVSLALVLPAGISFFEAGTESRRIEEKGFIDSGETVKETFKIVVTADSASERELRAEALYIPSNLGQRLLTAKTKTVNVKNPITLSLSSPEVVSGGGEFEWATTLKNESGKTWRVSLQAEFPEGISGDFPEEAIVIPSGGEERRVFLSQALLEEGVEEKVVLKVLGGVEGDPAENIVAEKSFIIRAARPSLGISALVNGEANLIASPGGELQYSLTVTNNAGFPIADIFVEAMISGQMFDFQSLTSSGRVSSERNKVVWDSGTTKELARLSPGERVVLPFSVMVRDEFPLKNFNDKNFVLRVDVKAKSTSSVSSGGKPENVASVAKLRTKVSGKIDLLQKIIFRDADSGLVNDGPFPPKVGLPTEYTVRWKFFGYGSDMENVVVSARLAPGARFTGKSKVPVGEFAEEGGFIKWKLPKLIAGTGVLSGSPEAIFQVSFTPGAGDAGGEAEIIREIFVSSYDAHAGVGFENFFPSLTTGLRGDPTVKPGEGIVIR